MRLLAAFLISVFVRGGRTKRGWIGFNRRIKSERRDADSTTSVRAGERNGTWSNVGRHARRSSARVEPGNSCANRSISLRYRPGPGVDFDVSHAASFTILQAALTVAAGGASWCGFQGDCKEASTRPARYARHREDAWASQDPTGADSATSWPVTDIAEKFGLDRGKLHSSGCIRVFPPQIVGENQQPNRNMRSPPSHRGRIGRRGLEFDASGLVDHCYRET